MNSKIILAKNIKLDKDYNNVLSYNNTQLLEVINANKIAEDDHYSFIRKGLNQIDVGFSYATCLRANYIAFQNPDYSNKWFFAFIDNIEYRSDGCTRISYSIDLFSTWYGYWDKKACFVIREHVDNDTIGYHTVPEGVELGSYIVNDYTTDPQNSMDLKCIVASTLSPGELINLYGGIYNNIPSGITYYIYGLDQITKAQDPVNSLQGYLEVLESSKDATPEAVKSIFLAPTWLAPSTGGVAVKTGTDVGEYTITVPDFKLIDNYRPRNNKLYTYPYCYYDLTNGQGGDAILHPELWITENGQTGKKLRVWGCLTPGCSIRAVPLNYNGVAINFNEGLNLGKFPQINWTTDHYTNWLTENGVNVATGLGGGAIATGVGIYTGNPVAIAGGVMSIANSLNQVHQHEMVPPQANGNLNNGDVVTATGFNEFRIIHMCIKQEYARIIDDYFTRQGYKVNVLKNPNLASRTNFNYIQIGDKETIAYSNNDNVSIPMSDLKEINNIFRRGVTLWHNYTNLGDFSVTNTIV